jgi:hypothetical protein
VCSIAHDTRSAPQEAAARRRISTVAFEADYWYIPARNGNAQWSFLRHHSRDESDHAMETIMKFTVGALIVCLLALPAAVLTQGSVDGKWTGEITTGRGPQPVTLSLKADGGKLTGTVLGGRGGEVTINDGTIQGNALKFKTTQQGRGGEVTFNWTGTLKGDEIAFSRMAEGGQGQAQEFVAKRQK